MATGFDALVDSLLSDIALCGVQGMHDLLRLVDACCLLDTISIARLLDFCAATPQHNGHWQPLISRDGFFDLFSCSYTISKPLH